MIDSSEPDTPAFADLAADPEIAPLLRFDPVVRRVKRPDGWTPDLQREFIALLAHSGSPRRAAEAMGKKVSGVEALYREQDAAGFRASWDQAVAIGKARSATSKGGARFVGRPPGSGRADSAGWAGPDGEDDISEDQKFELVERLANKFLRKVVVEREARLNGEIAAADFYLRQITHLEVMFDLISEGVGLDVWWALSDVQRGGDALVAIAETPFSQRLDAHRREYWAASGEPMRPLSLREEYLIDHGTHSTEPGSEGLGKCTDPPPGVEREAWAAMGTEEQVRVRAEVYAAAAASQLQWEAAARREYEQRRTRAAAADHPPDDWNGGS